MPGQHGEQAVANGTTTDDQLRRTCSKGWTTSLLGTLLAFGFGPPFVRFLQVLYTSAECLVKPNWTLTEPIIFRQGMHLGCLLSGKLYTLAIKPFLHRRSMGFMLHKLELRVVLSAYASNELLTVQDPGDLVQVEACQAIY
ncbi:unnamed protein product [Caretta caretta]